MCDRIVSFSTGVSCGWSVLLCRVRSCCCRAELLLPQKVERAGVTVVCKKTLGACYAMGIGVCTTDDGRAPSTMATTAHLFRGFQRNAWCRARSPLSLRLLCNPTDLPPSFLPGRTPPCGVRSDGRAYPLTKERNRLLSLPPPPSTPCTHCPNHPMLPARCKL